MDALELLEAARYGEEEEAAALLARPETNADVRDARGNSALHMAAANGHASLVRLLLHHRPRGSSQDAVGGVDVDAVNEHGSTALHWVCSQPSLEEGHVEVVRLVLEAGANPNIKNAMNRTALDDANERGLTQVCELLVKHDGRVAAAKPGGEEDGAEDEGEEEEGKVAVEGKKEEIREEEGNGNGNVNGNGNGDPAHNAHQQGEDNVERCASPKCGLVGQAQAPIKLMRCGRCKTARYCSTACQKAHWTSHKLACTPAAQNKKPK